jgi:hypothetical protein
MKRYTAWLALFPALGLLSGGWVSETAPALVFGLPFLLVWNASCIVVTAVVLPILLRADSGNRRDAP